MAKLTHMFDNYQDISCEKPNNMFPCKCDQIGLKTIIRGTTPEHFLFIPFNPKTEINKIVISYKQGFNVKVVKTLEDVNEWVQIDPTRYAIYYKLTQEETNSFNAFLNEPCLVQMKVELGNWDVVESDVYKIKVLDVLNDEVI